MYRFKPFPTSWDATCHKHPCSETEHLDGVLNVLQRSTIYLNEEDLGVCRSVAERRNNEAHKLRNLKVSVESDEFIHLIGAMGECALSKYLGVAYRGTVNTFRAADLFKDIEVRTRTAFWHDLKVRPDDQDNHKIVLAITPGVKYPVRLIGWIEAAKAKHGEGISRIDPRGAGQPFFAVPQTKLNPMDSLKQMYGKQNE